MWLAQAARDAAERAAAAAATAAAAVQEQTSALGLDETLVRCRGMQDGILTG